MTQISDDELRALLQAQFDAALGESASSLISDRRRNTLQRYRGERYGDEREGRSKFVSRDVFDVIESALPSLLKIFVSSDHVVEFEPRNIEDEDYAEQATDYLNYVFLNDNEGFNVLSTWFKDALLQINGFVKVCWEESEEWVEKRYSGIMEDQIAVLFQDFKEGEYVISEMEPDGAVFLGQGEIPTYRLRAKCLKRHKFARVINCAPEDVGVAPGTLDMDQAAYSYHRCRKTVSDLVEMGYDREMVMQALSYGESDDANQERATRAEFEEDFYGTKAAMVQDAMKEVVVTEHYIRLDYDGDGIAEHRKIITGGDAQYVIFDNEELDENPLVMITPIPLPHQTFGLSLGEVAESIQELKTTIQRQMLDNFYLINNSRTYLDVSKATEDTINDLLNDIPGGVVRGSGDRAISPIETRPLGSEPFTLLEYADSMLEQRTGITRYNQGLDADSLNKTATGIQIIQNASQERLLLMARFFGDGVRRVFGKLLRLTIRHQDAQRTFRLRNKWVTVDPSAWNAEMDVAINVGLGTGNKDQMLAHLVSLYNTQKELLEMGLPVHEKILHTLEKIVENMGFKNVEAFVPSFEEYQQVMQQQAAQPNPEQAQMEAQMQQEQQKFAFEQERAAAEMSMKERLEMQKIETDTRLQREKMLLDKGIDPQTIMAQQDAELFEVAKEQLNQTAAVTQRNLVAMQQQIDTLSQGVLAISEQVAQVAAISLAPRDKRVEVIRKDGRIVGANVIDNPVMMQ